MLVSYSQACAYVSFKILTGVPCTAQNKLGTCWTVGCNALSALCVRPRTQLNALAIASRPKWVCVSVCVCPCTCRRTYIWCNPVTCLFFKGHSFWNSHLLTKRKGKPTASWCWMAERYWSSKSSGAVKGEKEISLCTVQAGILQKSLRRDIVLVSKWAPLTSLPPSSHSLAARWRCAWNNRNTCTFNTRGLNSPSLGCIQVNLEYSQPAFQRNAIPFANVKKKKSLSNLFLFVVYWLGVVVQFELNSRTGCTNKVRATLRGRGIGFRYGKITQSRGFLLCGLYIRE